MPFYILSQHRCFGGVQMICRHDSNETATSMRFAVFLPPQVQHQEVPVVWFLAGLTCTEENFTTKAGAQRIAAELGLMLIAPDTSPRGAGVPTSPESTYDFGLGAGFYVDAVCKPWVRNYRMRSYIERELPKLIAAEFPADMRRQAIMGHSMGGHGALTIALRNPEQFASVSAFAPITSIMNCPWGEKALTGYLGTDRSTWRDYDCCELMARGGWMPELLVDQGTADPYLESQLMPQRLERACSAAKIQLTLRFQQGYDHSYYFIASFIEDHLRWHAQRLKSMPTNNVQDNSDRRSAYDH